MERVTAITVTFNRTKTLKKCLEALQNQTRNVSDIIVVDNNSCLDEKEKLKALTLERTNIHILWMDENLGGAGGFEAGMRAAVTEFPSDWYWIMDDDAYPRVNCLEELLKASEIVPESGFIAPLIYGVDFKEYQLYHHKHLKGLIFKNIAIANKYEELAATNLVEANAFVGPLISQEAVDTVGIADGSLFIYGDDTEYTYRISKRMKCYMVKAAVIDHQDPPLTENYLDPKGWWKEYYSYRNQYFMIREFHTSITKKITAYIILTLMMVKLILAAAIKAKYSGVRRLRIYLLLRSISDGLKNNRGKTLDPVEYSRKLKIIFERRT